MPFIFPADEQELPLLGFFIIHDIIIHGFLRLRLILCCLPAMVQVSVLAAAAAAAASGACCGGVVATIRSFRLTLLQESTSTSA